MRWMIRRLWYEHTRKNIHCFWFTDASNLKGFGAGSSEERMLVKRLAIYAEGDISAYEFKESLSTWFNEGYGVFLHLVGMVSRYIE
jgi:hypothetical protein